MTAQLIQRRDEWRATLDAARRRGHTVGLVLTMGSLHGGHLSLIRRARADHGFVAVTDYVNPLQFGDPADLVAYPRDVRADVERAAGAGADAVFAPTVEEMWPQPPATSVTLALTAGRLEDVARPGHLTGVATIVTKLLALAGPVTTYFGEKDYQQLTVVRRLVADLSLPVAVVGCPTVRETDGLALSSRNARLAPEQRQAAGTLYRALLAGKRAVEEDGTDDPAKVEAAMAAVVDAEPALGLDYVAVADPADLSTPPVLQGEVRLLVAARLGPVRLIDNLSATMPSTGEA